MLLPFKKKTEGPLAVSGGTAAPKLRRRLPVKRLIALALAVAVAGGGAWHFLGVSQNPHFSSDFRKVGGYFTYEAFVYFQRPKITLLSYLTLIDPLLLSLL